MARIARGVAKVEFAFPSRIRANMGNKPLEQCVKQDYGDLSRLGIGEHKIDRPYRGVKYLDTCTAQQSWLATRRGQVPDIFDRCMAEVIIPANASVHVERKSDIDKPLHWVSSMRVMRITPVDQPTVCGEGSTRLYRFVSGQEYRHGGLYCYANEGDMRYEMRPLPNRLS